MRGQGSWMGENQPKLSVANLSRPGLSLGQGTLNHAGVFLRVSWDISLTWVPGTWCGVMSGHWDSRVMLVKPGRAPELSWEVRGGEVLGLSLWLPSRDLPQTHHLGWDSGAAQGAHVNTPYAELECESEYTDHQGVCCSWPALFGEGNGNAFQYSCLQYPMNIGACQLTVHRVAKSQRWLSDFIFFHLILKFIYSTGSIFNLIIYIVYWSVVELQCFSCTARWSWITQICKHYFPIIFHFKLLQDIDYSSPCYRINLCCLLHIFF